MSNIYQSLRVEALPSGGYVISCRPAYQKGDYSSDIPEEQVAAFSTLTEACDFVRSSLLDNALTAQRASQEGREDG